MKRLSTMSTIIQIVSMTVILCLTSFPAGADPGDIGDICTPDGWCDEGLCRNGVCEMCGRPGDRCCPGNECYYAGEGYTCDATGYCSNTSGYDEEYCGYAGRPQCSWAPDTCYTGIASGGKCVACGDYYQSCCPNTDYECDYGECDTNRICVPRHGTTTPPGSSGTTGSYTSRSENHSHDAAEESATCFVGSVF